VGSHLIAALQGRFEHVRAVVRGTSNTADVRSMGVDVRVAALDDPKGLETAVSGSDVVIHLAALTHARSEAELRRVNGGGTRAVLTAALSAREPVRRFIYLSSLAAAGPSAGKPIGAEDHPHPLTAYGRTKLEGEEAISQGAGKLEAVILRAPAVYGPGDREMLRFFKLAKLGLLPLPAGPNRPLQLVHVKDLARGIADAATASELRGTFNIADAAVYAWRDVCELIGAAVGRKPLLLPVPQTAIAAAARASEALSGITGQSTMFNRDKVRELLAPGWLCETDSASREFGFEAKIPLADGLRSTAEWYRSKGWL
jgi:nucleoside-diphosphate-sugar epimerase